MAQHVLSKSHIVGGEQLAAAATMENRNPSDTSDLIGFYASGDAATVSLCGRRNSNQRTGNRRGGEQGGNRLLHLKSLQKGAASDARLKVYSRCDSN